MYIYIIYLTIDHVGVTTGLGFGLIRVGVRVGVRFRVRFGVRVRHLRVSVYTGKGEVSVAVSRGRVM